MYCSMLGSHYIDMILKSLYLQSIKHVMKLYYTRVCVCNPYIFMYIQTGSDRLYYPAKNPKTILQCMAGVGMFHMRANVSQLVMSFQRLYVYVWKRVYIVMCICKYKSEII